VFRLRHARPSCRGWQSQRGIRGTRLGPVDAGATTAQSARRLRYAGATASAKSRRRRGPDRCGRTRL